MDKQKSELAKVIAAMALDDLFDAKKLLNAEIDKRKGRAPKPIKWDAPMSTR